MAVEQCWLSLAVVLACRVFIFFGFSFPPSSLKEFGVWWECIQISPLQSQNFSCSFPSNLLLPSLFSQNYCHYLSLSFGMEDPTWKTPWKELACGVKHISSRRNMKCISSRWNNPLFGRWELWLRGTQKDAFSFIINLVFGFGLAQIVYMLLRKNLVCRKTDKSILDRWCWKKGGRKVAGNKGRSGCERRVERGNMSNTGSSKSVRTFLMWASPWSEPGSSWSMKIMSTRRNLCECTGDFFSL